MKVLIVDDNKTNLYLLKSIFERQGWEVRESENGKSALERAQAQPPDLIVSDILMPVMDGYTFCRECKLNEKLKQIPFVFYTATYTEPEHKQFSLDLGADRFILKPQEPQMLIKILLDLLAEKNRVKPATAALPDEELAFFRRHDEMIFGKLQKKMSDLETSNQSLQTLNEELEQRITKRTTQLAMTNKELESFSYSVSHDLRAPLRIIDGFIQILMEDYAEKLDNQGKDYLDRVQRAARHMDRLIEDLLKLSRVTQSEFQSKKVSLSDLVKNIAGICRQNSPQQTVDLLIQEGVWVHGDANLLRIALTNLLENAWKFTGRVVHPRIEFGVIIKDGSSIYYIRDNGAGFDMTHADKLFGAFQRFHSSEEFPGTGIGLATVKRIIDRHGGQVWAESEMQKGTTFYFTLSG